MNILLFGDMHAPYMHKNAIDFLRAVKKKYKPRRVICMGDEVDSHACSFYTSNPDLYSAGNEINAAKEQLSPLFSLFSNVDVLESNHGDLFKRKAVTSGLSKQVLKTNKQILEAPKSWEWIYDLILETKCGSMYLVHGKTKVCGKLSMNLGMSAAQGHYHSDLYVYMWTSPLKIYFDIKTGCLCDPKSPAFNYGRNAIHKQSLGCVMIVDGIPRIVPMILDKKNRWTGEL